MTGEPGLAEHVGKQVQPPCPRPVAAHGGSQPVDDAVARALFRHPSASATSDGASVAGGISSMQRSFVMVAVSVAALIGFTPAQAAGMQDFADAVKDATGDYNRAWVLTKLTTFKLGAKCWAKLPDKNNGAIHTASFATRDVVAYAKGRTGEDWSRIETQNNNDREANKQLLEPMMDAFKAQFSVTVQVDGDDCDATSSSLWLRYWSDAVSALHKYPTPAGKAFITINVSSKIRELTVEVGKDGATFLITAPKDIEAKQWNDKLERPFRKLASGIADDLAFAVKESSGDFHRAWVLTKFHTFKLGKRCAAKLGDPDRGAVHAASYVTRDLVAYARSEGADDWDAIEGQRANEPAFNRELVAKDMDRFGARFSMTVSVEGEDCELARNDLWLRYWTTIATALKDHPPKAKKVAITLDVTAKAKDVTAKVGKDGATFVFTAPRDTEVTAWDSKFTDAFRKVAKKK